MDQSHPSLGDQTQEERFLWYGIARDQLLADSRKGIAGDRSAVEERGAGEGMDALRNATNKFHATVSLIVDTD